MTFLMPFLAAIAVTATPQAPDCSLPLTSKLEQRVFTNADLDRMAACRYQTGAQSEVGTSAPNRPARPARGSRGASPAGTAGPGATEADWRARWRSVDQKTRKLRQEARVLRQEASEAPRDPKKQPTGRRSPTLLVSRARSLEAEAREIEDEFQQRARREGALPGWLRSGSR